MVRARSFVVVVCALVLCACAGEPEPWPTPEAVMVGGPVVERIDGPHTLDSARWVRSFRGPDGTIYFRHGKVSTDGGRTIETSRAVAVDSLLWTPERAFHVEGDSLYVVAGRARLLREGVFVLDCWRSTDRMQTVRREQAMLYLPPGPTREPEPGEWYGVWVFRNIVDLGDGVWLMSMTGCFAEDETVPVSEASRNEGTFMGRSFVVRSEDGGRTWDYLATIARSRPGDHVGDGLVEPSMARLPDGRLVAVMRSGHHHPAYVTWSEDQGRTWSDPVYTGLDRACDPCLLVLSDGRLALSWGRRYAEGWSKLSDVPDHERWKYPGEGIVSLAVSEDGGRTWTNQRIARKAGSCYSQMIEVEPGVVMMQVDQWVWRLTLAPPSGA